MNEDEISRFQEEIGKKARMSRLKTVAEKTHTFDVFASDFLIHLLSEVNFLLGR